MPPTDIAVCPHCGSNNITIIRDDFHATYRYKCLDCGQQTAEHSQFAQLDGELHWTPLSALRGQS